MKIRVEARFKNENFREARILSGYETLTRLSRETGISIGTLCGYENFKAFPKRNIKKLEETLHCPFDYLFPKEYREAVNRNLGRKVSKTFELLELPEHIQALSLPSHEEVLCQPNKGKLLDEALKKLTDREVFVLKKLYGLDGERGQTLEEVGRQVTVTRERIRQIEAKALRKLKHPGRSRELQEAWGIGMQRNWRNEEKIFCLKCRKVTLFRIKEKNEIDYGRCHSCDRYFKIVNLQAQEWTAENIEEYLDHWKKQ